MFYQHKPFQKLFINTYHPLEYLTATIGIAIIVARINKIIKTIKFAKFEDILKNKEICKILLLSLKSWGFTLAELDDVDYMLYSLEKCSK